MRRFGTWLLLEPAEVDAYVDARVGREPLADAYRARHLAERLAGRRAPVKAAILDQRTVAGVGNIYADEALWRAQIHPLTPAAALGPDEVQALYRGIRAALQAGLRRQGSTLRDYRLPDGGSGGAQHEFKVYGRGGEPCDRCGTPIDKIRVAGRGTWYCPSCQRLAESASEARAGPALRLARMGSRTYKTEAIVLRSMRFSEADRILHLYTAERGRIGAIAKGVRKTKSRFGARLEPLSHVELMLHEGAGELQTITGVELLRSHHAVREDTYRLNVGLIGAEAMLRLFGEPEANERAFGALARFLDLLDETPPLESRPALDPLVLSFQLKLLWLAGYLPHLTSCVECGADAQLVGVLGPRGRRRVRSPRGECSAALAGGHRRHRAAALDTARRRGGAPAWPSERGATPWP